MARKINALSACYKQSTFWLSTPPPKKKPSKKQQQEQHATCNPWPTTKL